MTIASIHVADVGPGRALRMLRGPGNVAGLVSGDAAIAAPLRTASGVPTPMPGRVAFVGFWATGHALDGFLGGHPYARRLASGWQARLEPLRGFGSWPGLPANIERARKATTHDPVVVITLGRVRLRRLRSFLRGSRPAEAAATASPGFLWGTALVRPPFVSTLSLWESARAAANYAYEGSAEPHGQAIVTDRQLHFHVRSAFVRFAPSGVIGALEGKNPLPEGLLPGSR